uniref:Ion transport domain-containing protein n=1 Tax=Phocoena sinus TaxID=42100 RepID=A0A8C9B5B4_PHOSS
TEADTEAFSAHDGVQAFLTEIWWGDMASGTPILRLLGAFLCPALVYTNLITFRSVRTERLGGLGPSGGPVGALPTSLRVPRTQSGRGPRAASLFTRWRKFWGAPVTVVLGNVVTYFAFLFLFTHVLLVDSRSPPQGLSGAEVTLYFWVFTLVLEEIWQVSGGPRPPSPVPAPDGAPIPDGHSLAMAGLSPASSRPACLAPALPRRCPLSEAGRTILAIGFTVFMLRLLHVSVLHEQLGPRIIIVERTMKDVSFLLFLLSTGLVAYGVTSQALLHPHDGRLEWIFRRVLYRPYLQIFGQIPLDEIDEACVNCSVHPPLLEDSPSCPNLDASWPVTFLLVTNVLLMKSLIAMLSYTFQVVQGNADIFWKFQRYHLILEYHERPALDPPFILLSHLNGVLKRPEHPELRRPQRLSDPQTHPKGLGHRMGEDGKVSQSGSPPRPALSGLRPACSYPRVDFVAKYLGGLREQEKRVERLESQVGRHTRAPFSPGAGAWPRGSAVRAGAGQGGPGASYLYPPFPEGETLQLSPGGSCI